MGEPVATIAEEPALLLVLDGLVRRDGAASGLRHEVQVGVEGPNGYRWWHARLGPRFTCGFLDSLSSTAHVTMCLSNPAADLLLRTGRITDDVHIEGDREVLKRFFERYTSKTSLFGARIASVQARRDRDVRRKR